MSQKPRRRLHAKIFNQWNVSKALIKLCLVALSAATSSSTKEIKWTKNVWRKNTSATTNKFARRAIKCHCLKAFYSNYYRWEVSRLWSSNISQSLFNCRCHWHRKCFFNFLWPRGKLLTMTIPHRDTIYGSSMHVFMFVLVELGIGRLHNVSKRN